MRAHTMRLITSVALLAFLGVLATNALVTPNDGDTASSESPASPREPVPRLENLLKAELEGVEGIEVIVSRVSIPPHTSLPKHWHPGEEFGYVLEGSVTLWQEGKDNLVVGPGDVIRIPLKQVHTAITTEETATVLVFRVHEQGQPERVLMEE